MTFILNVLQTTWGLHPFTGKQIHTSVLFCHCSVIPSSVIKVTWLLSQTLKPITPLLSLQSITVPLCHHILPHPIDFPEHSHYRSSYFLLILGHWQVNSVDYQCDEDIRGLKWEARKRHTEAVSDDLHAACGRAAVCRQRAIGAFHLCQPEGTTKKTQNKKLIISQTFSFWSIFNIHHVNKMNQCNKQGPSYNLILLNERQDFNVVPHNQRSTMLISLNL